LPDTNLVREAFEKSLKILGESAVAALIEDLKAYGVFLDDPEINFAEIMKGLRQILGDEACDLLAERFFINYDELNSRTT